MCEVSVAGKVRMSPTQRRSVGGARTARSARAGRLWIGALLIGAMTAVATSPVGAQQPTPLPSAAETATARALFEEGVKLLDEERWAEAVDRFERVLSIRWSTAAAFNLAAALVELGRLLDASELYRQVAHAQGAAPAMRAEAQRVVDELQPRLGRLHVLVAGDTAGVEIYVDGQPLPPAAWGVPVIVDPGTHTVMALRGGETLASQSAIVGDGAPLEAEVILDLPDAAGAPTPAEVAAAYEGEQAPGAMRDEGEAMTDAWWFWAGVGVLAATAVTVVLIAVAGSSSSSVPIDGTLDPGVLMGKVEEVR